MSSEVGEAYDEARLAYAEAAADIFPDVCAIQRPTVTQGASGGSRPAWTTATGLSAVPCRYKAQRGFERDAAGGVTAFSDFEIKLPYYAANTPVAVSVKDRIVVAARGTQTAKTFEVVSILYESSGTSIKCQAVLRSG